MGREDFFWLRLKSGMSLDAIPGDGDCGRFPKDFIWRWRVDFIPKDDWDEFAQIVSDGARPLLGSLKREKGVSFCEEYASCRICSSKYFCSYLEHGPVFDDKFADWIFGSRKTVSKIREIIARTQVNHLISILDFDGIEMLYTYIQGMLEAGIDHAWESMDAVCLEDNPRAERQILSTVDDRMRIWQMVSEYLESRIGNASEKPLIPITSEMRRFSLGWPQSWRDELDAGFIMKDCHGEMKGIVNLDTGVEEEAIRAMSAIASKTSDRRALPFELVRIRYPEIPSREDIAADIRTLLEKYGMPEQPALWAVTRKRGKKYAVICALCRIPRFPDGNDRRSVAKLCVIRKKDYGSGRPSLQGFWPGARQAASAALCGKYGLDKAGLSFDPDGTQTGPVNQGAMALRKNARMPTAMRCQPC